MSSLQTQTITLAGGCFWCTEAVFTRVRGVTGVQSGYVNGQMPDPTYEPLAAELRRILDGRDARLPATLQKLRDVGIDIHEHDVRRLASGAAAVGRPHVADHPLPGGESHTHLERRLSPPGALGVQVIDAPEQVLGRTIYNRLALQSRQLGGGSMYGQWITPSGGPRMLHVYSGSRPLAEFIDRNRDGRAELVLLNLGR